MLYLRRNQKYYSLIKNEKYGRIQEKTVDGNNPFYHYST